MWWWIVILVKFCNCGPIVHWSCIVSNKRSSKSGRGSMGNLGVLAGVGNKLCKSPFEWLILHEFISKRRANDDAALRPRSLEQ